MRVVEIGEYITKIGNKVSGVDKYIAAIELLYKENKVIDKIESKGRLLFVVEPKK